MKFSTSRLLIAVLAFALGVTAFWIASHKYIFWQNEVSQPTNTNQIEATESNSNVERFTLLGHACGNGWAQGYELSDGQRISTGLDVFGSPKKAQSELSKTLSKSERIITIVEKYRKPSGEFGKRTVAEFISEKTGKNVVGIFWRKNGEDSYEYIYAPTLEIALEFEQYQESQ